MTARRDRALRWFAERDLLGTGSSSVTQRAAHYGVSVDAYKAWVYGSTPTPPPAVAVPAVAATAGDANEAMLARIAARYTTRWADFLADGVVFRQGAAYPVLVVERPADRPEVYVIGPGIEGWVRPDELQPVPSPGAQPHG